MTDATYLSACARTGHTFASVEQRDRFVADELRARRALMRRIAASGPVDGIVATRRAQERSEHAEWRALERRSLGREVAQWDAEHEAAVEHVAVIEDIDARQRSQEVDAIFAVWNDPEDGNRNRLLEA
jgi:hypothetical protein